MREALAVAIIRRPAADHAAVMVGGALAPVALQRAGRPPGRAEEAHERGAAIMEVLMWQVAQGVLVGLPPMVGGR